MKLLWHNDSCWLNSRLDVAAAMDNDANKPAIDLVVKSDPKLSSFGLVTTLAGGAEDAVVPFEKDSQHVKWEPPPAKNGECLRDTVLLSSE
ncbi:hypothetical protein ACA910_010879 [Epithemia clementina (nom. ined.)]